MANTILVVDDQSSVRQLLQEYLTGQGYRVITATDGQSAIYTARHDPPDLILLDPPRAGAGVDACQLLAAIGPRRIVYVSCDPATLGRDLAALIQSGYRLLRLQLVDMFPQTYHMEAVATLER